MQPMRVTGWCPDMTKPPAGAAPRRAHRAVLSSPSVFPVRELTRWDCLQARHSMLTKAFSSNDTSLATHPWTFAPVCGQRKMKVLMRLQITALGMPFNSGNILSFGAGLASAGR